MKKIMLFFLVICFYINSHAQISNDILVSTRTLGADRSAVRAAREFWKKYGEGRDESWYKLDGCYLAEFAEGPIHYKSVFDRKGNWLYAIKECAEKDLPRDVRALVKSTYYDYSIGWVKEVSQNQSVVYVVHISNAPEWKDLLVQDGAIEVQHEGNR